MTDALRMYGVRKPCGSLVCIMRTKRLAKAAAEELTGKPWRVLEKEAGLRIVPATVGLDLSPEHGPRARVGESALWVQFERGQSFLVWPRSMMHEMPDDWQLRAAELLEEWDAAWRMPDDWPVAYISARDERTNRFTRWPDWLLNYKYRDRDKIDELKVPK
jgi:hypothetical protein